MFRKLAGLSVAVFALSVSHAAPKLSIRDYFLLLPEKVMPDGASSAADRKALLTGKNTQGNLRLVTDDPANGYLSVGFEGRMQQGLSEFAIWRSDKGEDIIGVNTIYTGVGGTEGYLQFYALRNEEWQDVTKDVFADFCLTAFKPRKNAPGNCQGIPMAKFPSGFSCKLPRKGLTIVCKYELFCETPVPFKESDLYAKPVVNFHWQKNRFVAK
ncbi:MAG: hypothetical protein JSR44_15555 [Spirochaetes bacterium]|nr:hypothetical protein [Spirochaetota bacterium]